MSGGNLSAQSLRSQFGESLVFSLRTAVASHKGLLRAYSLSARNFFML